MPYANTTLTIRRSGLKILKAELANILEDSIEDLKVTTSAEQAFGGKSESEIKLNFRGFEVKTIKLTVEKGTGGSKSISTDRKARRDSSASAEGASSAVQNDGWIKL